MTALPYLEETRAALMRPFLFVGALGSPPGVLRLCCLEADSQRAVSAGQWEERRRSRSCKGRRSPRGCTHSHRTVGLGASVPPRAYTHTRRLITNTLRSSFVSNVWQWRYYSGQSNLMSATRSSNWSLRFNGAPGPSSDQNLRKRLT